jgi:Holliday junction DNA helicase RuvB
MEEILEPKLQEEEVVVDTSLRPKQIADFIGQAQLKENLGIFLQAAKQREETMDHVLFYGPPGLGKTTLATIIASEMGVNIRTTSGPALERVGDVAAILTNLEAGDILFIDEIHRIHKTIEEVLYPAMEECALDIVIGKGPSARTVRLDLPRFTLVGATTRLSLLSAPLRDRFGATFHLDLYTTDDLTAIVARSAAILGMKTPIEAARAVAVRSRGTPRIANRLLKRVRDYAEVVSGGTVTVDGAEEAMSRLAIDALGLDATDRRILSVIIEKFGGGPVGVQTIAAATSEEIDTIELVHEPYLLQLGFLQKTPRGRMATAGAYAHIGVPLPTPALS